MMENLNDKDFLEDSGSGDEFDKKFEDSVLAYKENSRPSSSSSRPKTASRHRDDTESRINLIASATLQIYFRISKFISSKRLSKSEILSRTGEYLTAQALQDRFCSLGFDLSESEVSFIFRDLGVPKTGVVRMEDIYNKLIAEAREDEEETPRSLICSNTEILRKEAELLLMDSRKRLKQKKKLREKSQKSVKSQKKNSPIRPISASSSSKQSNIKMHLRESKEKTSREKEVLNTTVDKCRREFEFDILKKMGEANDILSAISSNTTYRCLRKEDRSIKCQIFINENFVEEITMENFIREWKRLKKKKNTVVAEPSLSQLSSKNVTAVNAKVSKAERTEELKKLLMETRELTTSLKRQLKVLEKKGIVRRSVKGNLDMANRSKADCMNK